MNSSSLNTAQVNEEEEAVTRSSNNKNNKGRRKVEENSTIEMIDRLTDVSRLNNTETVM